MDLAKENYRAWLVKPDDFPTAGSATDQLYFLLNFSVLAPSTHNSQPWKFQVQPNKILLFPDFSKAFRASDPANHFLGLSLGCALENILIAADYFGFNTEVAYCSCLLPCEPAAVVSFGKIRNGFNTQENLLPHITKRYTSRANFNTRPVPDSFLRWMHDLNKNEIHVDVVLDQGGIKKVIDLVDEFTKFVMSTSDFRKELADYVRSNVTRSKTGMPAFVMGVPTVVSIFLPLLMRYINITKFQKEKQEAALHTPSFVVISTRGDEPKDWMSAGQIFERISVAAAKDGMCTHPLAAVLHANNHERLRQAVATNFRPQFLFRLGYPTSPVLHTPRLTVVECLV